ncbi:MAG: hypothetical protein QGG48_06205 [Desulfatiglandales bacterium]|nr:hypothetical protein [Desulfatiglandales bacterium]
MAGEVRPLLILQELAGRIVGHSERIQVGLGTGYELLVVKFLWEEVESVFSI